MSSQGPTRLPSRYVTCIKPIFASYVDPEVFFPCLPTYLDVRRPRDIARLRRTSSRKDERTQREKGYNQLVCEGEPLRDQVAAYVPLCQQLLDREVPHNGTWWADTVLRPLSKDVKHWLVVGLYHRRRKKNHQSLSSRKRTSGFSPALQKPINACPFAPHPFLRPLCCMIPLRRSLFTFEVGMAVLRRKTASSCRSCLAMLRDQGASRGINLHADVF